MSPAATAGAGAPSRGVHGWTIADYRAAYGRGTSVRETIAAVLAELDDAPSGVLIGPPLHERAMADAVRLDGIGPTDRAHLALFGVPIAVKDNIDVADVETTAACPGFAYVAERDAAVVARLRAAGAVMVAKTNMDQFATGLVGTRSPYGIPANVIDPELAPGGSSSGSAVAVALGLVPAALGTDTAGSGRVPAALNAIVGLKPTVGRASGTGIVPAMRRFDCPTVFARTVEDAVAVGDVMAALDTHDPYSRSAPQRGIGGELTVGAPERLSAELDINSAAWRAFEGALARLSGLGIRVTRFSEADLDPLLAAGRMLYGSALVAERFAAVGDAMTAEIDGLDPVVAGIIGASASWSAADAYRAEYALERLRTLSRPLWDRIDVLALPTTPGPVSVAQVAADPLGTNERLGRLTSFANLLDLCAIVVPPPRSPRPLPFGLQLLAPAWSDALVADLAATFQGGTARRSAHRAGPALGSHGGSPVSAGQTIVVVGAHLGGQPLNHQLSDRRATLVTATHTAPVYRLYALSGTVPAKPGLVRTGGDDGAAIAVEVWHLSDAEFGGFVGAVPPPLCIGSVELADGSWHKGFLCEPLALSGATDITKYGGWRAYLAAAAGRASMSP